MRSEEVWAKARELVGLIKAKFVRPDGLLARNYPVASRTLFDNFDDLVPFFLYFGEKDFLISQVHTIRKKRESILTLCSDGDVLLARGIDEWIGGLYSLWKATHDNVCFALLSESVYFVLDHLMKNNFLSGAFRLRNGKAAPYYEPWSAGLLEVACEMREEFPGVFEHAKNVLHNWITDEYFRQHAIFPFRVYRSSFRRFSHKKILCHLRPNNHRFEPKREKKGAIDALRYALRRCRFEVTPGWYSFMMKSNSTPAFTLLRFYLATGDRVWAQSLSKWCDSAIEGFCNNGRVFAEFHPLTGERRAPSVTPAFILADVLCDAAWFVPQLRRHLPKVRDILDYQWADRLPTGMVPYHDHGNYAHIDSQVDLSISLRRYAELSGDSNYLSKSVELMDRMLSLHYSPEGYFTFSGGVDRNVIDPKYNALALKGMINLLTIGEAMYPKYYDMFKDR